MLTPALTTCCVLTFRTLLFIHVPVMLTPALTTCCVLTFRTLLFILDLVCPPEKYVVVYYESMKRKLKIKPIYECRCNGRLQTKRFTRLPHTGLSWKKVRKSNFNFSIVSIWERILNKFAFRCLLRCSSYARCWKFTPISGPEMRLIKLEVIL
jgi:hypothetical protein